MADAAEMEWLTGGCPYRMYGMARVRAATRQVRRYMVPCCHLQADTFFDPRLAQALAASELCADDPRAETELEALWNELLTSPRSRRAPAGSMGAVGQAILAARDLLDEHWAGAEYQSVRHALAHAAYLSLRERPGDVFTGGEGDAAEGCAKAVEAAEVLKHGEGVVGEGEIRRRMAVLLRDIFGNPFRPVTLDLTWLTCNVLDLARTVYDERAFDRLPILADALMDAGCADEQLLTHCRSEGPHVRGCWVVDLVVGKR